ncbi:penicillin acylase family protein [Streptomyces sp. NPDC016845]|uniref:penicillin acylase family protein n=1 Tax=Streptomyces sp. NPDC016845 TaxID=3364972 RepID=UPI00379783EA
MAVATAALGLAAVLPGPASADPGSEVRISRTAYGVPHILARDFDGLGRGYGYAFAQDNVCELADQVVTQRGERSRWFGPDGNDGEGVNLASDAYYTGQRRAGTVERLLAREAPLGPTPELRRMVQGYADGYNRYLRETGVAHLPDPRCKGKPWARPITALDLWSVIHDVNRVSGTRQLVPEIGDARPPGTDTATSVSRVPGPARSADFGSNGWALGRDATRGGNAMVLANPHLPWADGALRFYQVHLTIPGTLDVSGAGLYGTPLVLIGHNKDVAWTHTASDAEHGSMYALELAAGDPTSYVVDGRTERMGRRTVPVTVRGADGRLTTVERTLYTSRFGPVLSTGWTTKTAYTYRDANADNLRSMNTWLAMGRASNLDELRTAQDTSQGNPWTYTLAADTSGDTYFTDASAVPHLTDAQLERCTLPGGPAEPDALDGSTSACAWGSDPDALVPGLYGPSHQPELTRADYVANSNNGPRYTNRDAPLTGFPGTYDTGDRLGLRAELGLRMIAERRDGSDGLGAPGFTAGTLRATMFGNRVLSAETGRDDLVALCRAHPVLEATDGRATDVRRACAVLARWDTRADTDSRGAALWGTYYDHLMESRSPDETGQGRALADAVRDFAAEGLPVDTKLGTLQKWAGVPLPGCDGGKGCFNVLEASPESGTGTPTAGAFGSSFLMAVELTPDGPRARTLLTYGQSANPASPHYADQTRLFSRKRWVTERFTAAEIAADPHLEVKTLRG